MIVSLTVEIVIGREGTEFGPSAIFIAPPGKPGGELYGPVIPGPDIKKANTSL